MKKILVVLGSIVLGLAPISTVISCFGSPKEKENEKIKLTEESLKEWIFTQQFGYEGEFYFLDGNETDEYAYSRVFNVFRYKIENTIARELNKRFHSNDSDLWNVYVWVRQGENEDIINSENGFKSQKEYKLKYELTITNKNPKNKIELEFKELFFNFKQTNKIGVGEFEKSNLNHVLENFNYYKNILNNPFNWGGKGDLFSDVKQEIISHGLLKARNLIENIINPISNGERSNKIPFKSFYFTSVINEIHAYEKIEGTDKIKFKLSATSTFVNLEGKPTIDWEAIYII